MIEQDKRPNIKFTGRDKRDRKTRKLIERALPISSFMHERTKIVLPGAAEQLDKRKFYHANAKLIRDSFPHLYKLIIPKKGRAK